MSVHRVARAVFGGVLLILPVSAFAQEIGVKAGVNFASLPPEEDEHPDIPPRLGPVGGGWVRTAPANRFSFQAEGLFSEKGTHWDFSPDVSIEIRVRYIEIPLLARADVGPASLSLAVPRRRSSCRLVPAANSSEKKGPGTPAAASSRSTSASWADSAWSSGAG